MMRCQMNRNFEVELTTLCMIRNQKNEILVQERQKRIGLVGRSLADMLKKIEGMETAMVRELLEENRISAEATISRCCRMAE